MMNIVLLHKELSRLFVAACISCSIFLSIVACTSSGRSMVTRTTGQSDLYVSANDTLTSQQQRRFQYFYLEALRLKGKKEYASAFEMLRHCMTIDPHSSSALFEIGQYYITLGDGAKGLRAFKEAVQLSPGNYWYNQALANLYDDQNDTIHAIETLETMTQRFPERKEPLYNLIDMYSQKNDYVKEVQTLDRVEKLIGKTEQTSMEKFRAYQLLNDTVKAYAEIESLSKQYPSDNRYKVVLGDLYLQNGRKEDAHGIYNKVLKDDPDNAMALYSMANYYKSVGQTSLYERQLNTLLLNKKIPSETKVEVMKQYVSQCELDSKDSTVVINMFDRIVKQDPDDVQIPMLYANYLISKGMNEQSLPVLQHIVNLDPSNVAARLMLLSSAIKKEDYKSVIKICEPGIEATPESLELYFYLAIAYNQAARYDDALNVSRKALTHVKSDSNKEVVSDFYALIGDLLHTKNKDNEAFAAYDSSLVYNAQNIGALNNYAYYLSVKNIRLDKAEEMSYTTVKAEPTNSTYLDTYAWILFIKGKYTQALIYIDNAMKNGGESSDVVTEHCGDIHAMTGDIAGALKYWQKSLKQGNKSKTLKQKIQKKKYIAQ